MSLHMVFGKSRNQLYHERYYHPSAEGGMVRAGYAEELLGGWSPTAGALLFVAMVLGKPHKGLVRSWAARMGFGRDPHRPYRTFLRRDYARQE